MAEKVIWSLSGVNPKGEPFVQLRVGGAEAPGLSADAQVISQFTPAEARGFGQQVLECAEAAETDAFLFEFFTKTIGADRPHAMQVILNFRKWREGRGGVKVPTREDYAGEEFKKQREAIDAGVQRADGK